MQLTLKERCGISTTFMTTFLKESYVVILLSVLGVAALLTATIVAYPAIAYFASMFI